MHESSSAWFVCQKVSNNYISVLFTCTVSAVYITCIHNSGAHTLTLDYDNVSTVLTLLLMANLDGLSFLSSGKVFVFY